MVKMGFDVQGWATLGAVAGAITYGIGWVAAKFGGLSVNFATIDVAAQRGAVGQLGNQILALTPFAKTAAPQNMLVGIIAMIIAGAAIALIGRFLLTFIEPYLGAKTVGKRVTAVFALGLLTAHIVLLRPGGLPAIPGAIAIIILSVVLSMIIVAIANSKVLPVNVPQN